MLIRPLRIAKDRWRHRNGPWADLFEPYRGEEVVSLDCETSGMDPRSAHLLSIAAVRISGRRILTSEALDVHLAPPAEMDPESIRVHPPQEELARMLGGVEVSKEARAAAKRLLGNVV